MKKILLTVPVFFTLFLFPSCKRSFQPIEYGKDACASCKMTIMDDRYATELIDSKGKVFKFDDLDCMKHFTEEKQISGDALFFVEDYLKKEKGALNAATCVFLHHDFFRSPMNGNYAAFATEEDAAPLKDSLGIVIMKWENVK